MVGLIALASVGSGYQATGNPVVGFMRRLARESSRNVVGEAESMPLDKWSFKATPQVMSFGEIMAHIADDNNQSCRAIAGANTQTPITPKPSDARDQVIAGLKLSFAFCDSALSKVDDSQLGKNVSYYGESASLGRVLIGLANDWGSHYSQAAVYLRLNGILPPTARPRQ